MGIRLQVESMFGVGPVRTVHRQVEGIHPAQRIDEKVSPLAVMRQMFPSGPDSGWEKAIRFSDALTVPP